MPRLLVLNGPPGVGKSTIAQRYVAAHPLALNLEIDRIRRLLGGWQDDANRATLLARDIALGAARTHLAAGYDVVLPHYVGRVDYLARLESLATSLSVDYSELVLSDNRDVVAARFLARNRASSDPVHREAQELLDAAGGPDQLMALYDRLLLVLSARPQAHLVTAHEGDIDGTYAKVIDRIGEDPARIPGQKLPDR